MRARVIGRVQNVGFRFFVRDEASRLGLTGTVRNLSDGRSIEVEADGERAALEALVEALHRGPPAARVERVEVDWDHRPVAAAGFRIAG